MLNRRKGVVKESQGPIIARLGIRHLVSKWQAPVYDKAASGERSSDRV